LYQVPYDEPLLNGDQWETSKSLYKVIVNTRPPVPPIAALHSLVPKPRAAASFKPLVGIMQLVVTKPREQFSPGHPVRCLKTPAFYKIPAVIKKASKRA
jgi:hypothetical protein